MSRAEMLKLADWLERKIMGNPTRIQLDEDEARLAVIALQAALAGAEAPGGAELERSLNYAELELLLRQVTPGNWKHGQAEPRTPVHLYVDLPDDDEHLIGQAYTGTGSSGRLYSNFERDEACAYANARLLSKVKLLARVVLWQRKHLAHPAPPQPQPAADEAMRQVGELLAVIHGDGGHYQQEHGLEQAAREAIRQYYLKLHGHDISAPFLDQPQPQPAAEAGEVKRLRESYEALQDAARQVAEGESGEELAGEILYRATQMQIRAARAFAALAPTPEQEQEAGE